MNRTAQTWAERRAEGIAIVLASSATTPFEFADEMPDELVKPLKLLEGVPGALYGSVFKQDGTLVASWSKADQQITSPLFANPIGETPKAAAMDSDTPSAAPVDAGGGDLGFDEDAAVAATDLAGNSDAPLEERAADVTTPKAFVKNGVLQVRAEFATKKDAVTGKKKKGILLLGFSMVQLEKEKDDNTWFMIAITLLIFGFGLVGLSLLLSRTVIGPIVRLTRVTASIASTGNLTQKLEISSNDEVGDLARSFSKMIEWQRFALLTLRQLTESLSEVIAQISASGSTVTEGAATIQHQVEETSELIANMKDTIRQGQESVTTLLQNTEQSSATIQQIAIGNQNTAENIQAMSTFVDTTTGAIDTMALSVREIARSIADVDSAISDNSRAIKEMELTVGQVEGNALRTADLSAQVSADADSGVEAVQKTLYGIDMIRQSSESASQALDQLVKRALEVGNVLNVINDITGQTNLLALNAAIISAQAGEHGRGFSVVADEIRALAVRTRTSTDEIKDLIKNIQSHSNTAIMVMNEGIEAVNLGVRLGQETEGALMDIQRSAREATTMVKQIAHSTIEQSDGNKSIGASINRIAETVAQINEASRQQAMGSEQITRSTNEMRGINQQVFASSQEQLAGSKQVIDSIKKIDNMVQKVQDGQSNQAETVQKVYQAVQAIETVSTHQTNSAKHLEKVIESLRSLAKDLRNEFAQFKIE